MAVLVGGPAAADAKVTLKLATLAPEGSTWWKSLRKLGDEWTRITDGEVQVRIYAGGVVGNESSMVRKMNIGQLHGGQITNVGLAMYDEGPQVIQTPMLIRTDAELDYVMKGMIPTFEARLLKKGIVALNWGDAGWVHLFTAEKMIVPADAGNFKMYTYEGDPEAVTLYSAMGFQPVVLASTDVMPSLQSGLINAFPSTRLGALALQWFALSKNMLDVPWAPLVGATVLTEAGWNAIPEEHRAECKAAAVRIGAEMSETIRKQDRRAVGVMEKYGLVVNKVDDAARAEWMKVGESTWPIMRGGLVPEDVFDQARALVEEHRAANP
jgi:TRAP-type C4-dicarboxylate transport system substrate-binding protein